MAGFFVNILRLDKANSNNLKDAKKEKSGIRDNVSQTTVAPIKAWRVSSANTPQFLTER